MQGYDLPQGSASFPLLFLLVSSSDHISPLTGATPTVTLSKNGGAFASPAGAVTEIGSGWYKVAGNGTDTGTLGPLVLHATATGGDPADCLYPIVAYNPQSGSNLGLSALPTAAPGAAGGLPTSDASDGVKLSVGTGAGQVNVAGGKVPATMGSTDYSGNTVQTGDAFARIGATGSGLTSLAPAATALSTATWTNARAADLDNLDAAVSSRLAASSYTAPPTAAQVATAIWTDTTASDFTAAGSPGHAVLTYLDTNVGSRLATSGYTAPPTTSQVAAAILATPAHPLATDSSGNALISLMQPLGMPRAQDAVADSAVTTNDALWGAHAGAFGRRDTSSGTSMLVKTPSTATLLRTYAITTVSGTPTSYPTVIA